MDAGVPVKRVVAGVAMGALMKDKKDDIDEAIVLTDLMGIEDALGMMDFKIAGDKEGISTFQLDTKCEGLSIDFMKKALEQARVARLHIIGKMEELGGGVREALPPTVPKVRGFKIEADGIGKVIGPGGKQIRAIIEDYELSNMDVGEEGLIQISGFNTTKREEVENFVTELLAGGGGGRGGRGGGRREREPKPAYEGPEPVEGEIYTGKITGIHNWGVFLEIMPGLEGLCHVSELHSERVRNCEGFVQSLGVDELKVMYKGKNDRGQLQLSRKATMGGGGGGGDRGRREGGRGPRWERNPNPSSPPESPVAKMTPEEEAVIEAAIFGAEE